MKLAILCLMLQGCALGIPDAGPAPPPPPEPCQVWRKIDNGPWVCISRRRALEELKKLTPPGI